VADVPTVLIARTDALGAYLLTSDVDERDRAFCTGECGKTFVQVNVAKRLAVERVEALCAGTIGQTLLQKGPEGCGCIMRTKITMDMRCLLLNKLVVIWFKANFKKGLEGCGCIRRAKAIMSMRCLVSL
jgi:isocitrate lyase